MHSGAHSKVYVSGFPLAVVVVLVISSEYLKLPRVNWSYLMGLCGSVWIFVDVLDLLESLLYSKGFVDLLQVFVGFVWI